MKQNVSIGIVFLTDNKITMESNAVILQDGKDLQYGLTKLGYDCCLYYDSDFEPKKDYRKSSLMSMIFPEGNILNESKRNPSDNDIIIVEYGGVLDFGGKRKNNVIRIMQFINNFNGPVVLSSNDLRDTQSINGMQREKWGDNRILRPIMYASPALLNGNISEIMSRYRNIDFVKAIPFDFAAGVAWKLANGDAGYDTNSPLNTNPKYSVAYGGASKNRDFTKRVLSAFQHLDSCNAISYGSFAKTNNLRSAFNGVALSRSGLMKQINDECKWTLYVNESNKRWMTSRLFEQGLSSGLMLFDSESYYPADWNQWALTVDLLNGDDLDHIRDMPESKRIDLAQDQRNHFKQIDYEGWTRKAYGKLIQSILN